MSKLLAGAGLVLVVALGMSAEVWTQAGRALPVPGVEPARDVANAREIPDAKTDYKVLFDVGKGADKPTDVNPMLQATARYLNTLAKVGVPPEHRKIAVIFHQGGTSAILKNGEYRSRNNGQDNPNIAIIQALKKAGVEFHVCGQAVLAMEIHQDDIQPEIQVDLWALTTIVNFVQRGYVRIG